jgi:hypothetical protein
VSTIPEITPAVIPDKDTADPTASFWGVGELLEKIYHHDQGIKSYQVMMIVSELHKTGRLRAIGRRCDETGQPCDDWEAIPAHQGAELMLHLPPPWPQKHPGDLFWRSSRKRAWACVQFSEPDLMREWLGPIFARPPYVLPPDFEIPPRPAGNPATAKDTPRGVVQAYLGETSGRRSIRDRRTTRNRTAAERPLADGAAFVRTTN